MTTETSSGLSSLDFQVKRTVHIGENALFQEVMDQCWRTFAGKHFNPGADRFGIITGTESGKSAHLDDVLRWARHRASAADFFADMAKIASKPMRRFVEMVRSALKVANGSDVGDQRLWEFLRHLVFMPFDFEREDGSRDRQHAIERLQQVLSPPDVPRAADLWNALVDLADTLKSVAGTTDRAGIIKALGDRFSFGPSVAVREDLERLVENSSQALREISDDIAGLRLPRPELTEEARDEISGGTFLEIAGERGTGKSALLRLLAELAAQKSPVLVLKSDRLPQQAPGWAGLASQWQIKAPLVRIIAELGSAPSPCLFIDGLDRIESAGSWSLIRDLFDAISRSPAAPRWSIVATVRSSAMDYRTRLPLDALPGFRQQRLNVPEFGDPELTAVAAALPHLAPLIRDGGRARSLAARPYLLRLLARPVTHHALATSGRTLTEIDLMEAVWTDDGGGGLPLRRKRQELLLDLAQKRLDHPSKASRLSGADADALSSLVRDEILLENRVTLRVRFRHDILEDWVLSQVLGDAERPLAGIIREKGGAPWLVDAVQLMAMRLLEREDGLNRWGELLVALSASDLQPMWRRAVLAAPVRSTRSAELLDLVGPKLLEAGASLLRDLMVALRTLEVDPAPTALIDALFPGESGTRQVELAHQFAIPRGRPWGAFFSWLLPRRRELPADLFPATVDLLEILMQSTTVPAWIAKEVIPIAFHWLNRLEYWEWQDWDSHWAIGKGARKSLGLDRDAERSFHDRLRRLLLVCSRDAPRYARRYIRAVAQDRHHPGAAEILEWSNYLAFSMPSDCADFLLRVLVKDQRGQEDEELGKAYQSYSYEWDKLGINDLGAFLPPSHLRPPFLKLLQTSPTDGMRTIDGLCNAAMSAWKQRYKRETGRNALPIAVKLPWGVQEFWGMYTSIAGSAERASAPIQSSAPSWPLRRGWRSGSKVGMTLSR
ncbi:hypothetical protein [Azospirillum argentinense]|nr:hypothetical protein [Azospirillum argentinense]